MSEKNTELQAGYDVNEIMRRIPHRYPFLLVDRVVEWKYDDYLIAVKVFYLKDFIILSSQFDKNYLSINLKIC